MKRIIILTLLLMFVSVVCMAAPSNTITTPNSFSPNTTIQSSQVNSNNNEIATKYNAHSHSDTITTQYGGSGGDFSTTAQGSLFYFSAAGVVSALTPGTANYALVSNGAAANPAFESELGWTQVAWVNASGDGTTINDSYNCTSITDTGTGILTANWSITFGNNNYCSLYTVHDTTSDRFYVVTARSTTTTQVRCNNNGGVVADPVTHNIFCLGD